MHNNMIVLDVEFDPNRGGINIQLRDRQPEDIEMHETMQIVQFFNEFAEASRHADLWRDYYNREVAE